MTEALANFEAFLFDLDGVLTPTAQVHMRAWQETFDEFFAAEVIEPPYTDRDYYAYVDGKKRYDGVASLLASRGVTLPLGTPDDGPDERTVCGIGNRKNALVTELLERGGVAPYPGSLQLLDELRGRPLAVVSSSKNAEAVLRAAGIRDRFSVVVDGMTAEHEGLPSKPAPDMFLRAATLLQVDPARAAAFEDALSGVAAAAGGAFGLVVGVNRGVGADVLREAGADRVVDDLAELCTDTNHSP